MGIVENSQENMMRLFFLGILRSFLLQQMLLRLKYSSEKVTWWSVRVSFHWSDNLDDSCCWRDWKLNEFLFYLFYVFSSICEYLLQDLSWISKEGWWLYSSEVSSLVSWFRDCRSLLISKARAQPRPGQVRREERNFERRSILNHQVREKLGGATIMILIMAIN